MDATVCFFATDYYAHKDLYRSGEKVLIDLAALGLSVERTVEKISFTGEQAASFRLRIGQEPEYSEDGFVKPVDISMREGVAYLLTAQKTPDLAQFMSPVRLQGTPTLFDIPFYRVEMTLLRDTTRDDLNMPSTLGRISFPASEARTLSVGSCGSPVPSMWRPISDGRGRCDRITVGRALPGQWSGEISYICVVRA